jgi:hypothetical protein
MLGTNCDIQRKYMCRLCGKMHSSLILNTVVHTGSIFLQSFDKTSDFEASYVLEKYRNNYIFEDRKALFSQHHGSEQNFLESAYIKNQSVAQTVQSINV